MTNYIDNIHSWNKKKAVLLCGFMTGELEKLMVIWNISKP
jgi:hypothetical protein